MEAAFYGMLRKKNLRRQLHGRQHLIIGFDKTEKIRTLSYAFLMDNSWRRADDDQAAFEIWEDDDHFCWKSKSCHFIQLHNDKQKQLGRGTE